MNAPSKFPRGLSQLERDEILFGREHWTLEDYLEAGRKWFDEKRNGKYPVRPGDREYHAQCWMQMHCPHSKRVPKVDQSMKQEGIAA